MEAVLHRGRWLSETKEHSQRGKNPGKKRGSNLAAPCLIFIHTQALPLRPLPLPFLSLPLLSFPSQSGPSITYSLSLLPSHHSSPSLICSLADCICYGGARGGQKNTPKTVPPSRKYLQLEDKSILKHAEGIPLTLGCVPLCSGTFSGPKGSCLHVDIYPPQTQVI